LLMEAISAFLRHRLHVNRLMLLGDSGGSLVAGLFAARHPELVSRLVLFGPVTPFTQGPSPSATLPAYLLMTPQDLWSQFSAWADAAGSRAITQFLTD
jgi:pimeloyl-ACP methyl ester carboxylesterase